MSRTILLCLVVFFATKILAQQNFGQCEFEQAKYDNNGAGAHVRVIFTNIPPYG
jgi:hypothetical protein